MVLIEEGTTRWGGGGGNIPLMGEVPVSLSPPPNQKLLGIDTSATFKKCMAKGKLHSMEPTQTLNTTPELYSTITSLHFKKPKSFKIEKWKLTQ